MEKQPNTLEIYYFPHFLGNQTENVRVPEELGKGQEVSEPSKRQRHVYHKTHRFNSHRPQQQGTQTHGRRKIRIDYLVLQAITV
jgi:hypothetical protein